MFAQERGKEAVLRTESCPIIINISEPQIPVPQKMNLFGHGVFAEVIKKGLTSNSISVHTKMGNSDRHLDRKSNVKTQGGDDHLQAKGSLRPPESRRKA